MSLLATAALYSILATGGDTAIKVPYEKYVLPNGMKVILTVDKTLPVATINTWFYVGSKDEPDRRSGFAHLFEHLMFMGTNRVPTGQFDQIMEQAGGQNNASTAEDRTNYYSFGPSILLPTLIWLDADRLEDLGKAMTQKKLDLQRDVVKNERRQNTENTPYGKAYEAINGLMFPKGHPYSTSVIGSHEDLSAASVQDVQNFFSTFYVPNNASLVVAGDFDPAKIKPLINQLFGTLPRANDVPRKLVQPFTFPSEKLTMVDQVSAAKSILVWHTPPETKPGDVEMNIAASVLGDGLASRLQDELVNKLGLASDVSAFVEDRYLGSLFYIDATLANGKSQDDLEKAIDKVIDDLAKTGPTANELKRIVAKEESSVANTLQSIDQKADKMNEYEFYYGDPDSFQREIDAFRAATPASVKAAVQKYLKANRLTLRVVPETAEQAKNPRDERPTIDAPEAFSTPKPHNLKIGSQAVAYWSRPGVPMFSVRAHYDLGTIGEPKLGLVAMTNELMSRGAMKMQSAAFAAQLDLLGASINASTGYRDTTFSLQSPTSNAGKALELFGGVLTAPTISKDDFEQYKDELTAQLEQENDNPRVVMDKVGRREFLGKDHPYAKPIDGTLESVKSITYEDVLAMAKKVEGIKPTLFAAAGWDDQAAVSALAPLGQLKLGTSTGETSFTIPPIPTQKSRLIIVDRPNAVQTVINFLFPAVTDKDPDFLDLDAVRVVCGGSFTSRLNQNLREDKGYTYGAGSRLGVDPYLSWFTMVSSVRADVTGASLKEFLKEIGRLEKGDIDAVEAKKAGEIMRTDVITDFSTLGSITGVGTSGLSAGITLQDIDGKIAKLSNLSDSRLNEIARKYIQRSKAMIVLVGDKAEILKQIEGLGLPEPEIVTP
ncbi:MAG: insulinase family protein [Armatimonadetes bacterium]|nr:insulinase family protein [Armatimonadota bacterium]